MSNLKERILSLEPTKGDEFNDKRTALVDGVYMSNHPIRKKALSYVWAKYNMLPDALTDSLGRLYEIMEENIIPPKNYKGLFDYTHDKSSVYSNTIAEKNLTVSGVCGNTFNDISETPKEWYKAWHGTSFEGANYYQTIEDYLANTNNKNTKGLTYTSNNTLLPSNGISYAFDNNANIEFQNSIIENNNNSKPEPPKKVKRSEVSENEWELYNSQLKTYKKQLREWRKNKGERRQQNSDAIRNIEELSKQPITLVEKTSKLFLDNKIKTLTDKFSDFKDINESTEIDSAIVKGMVSHGRSLLRKKYQDSSKINGYDNPFCRAWTFHHQYGSNKNTLIRSTGFTISSGGYRKPNNGSYRDYSVLKNGFVKITPEQGEGGYNTKSCMFSIENLAWKDVVINDELSSEQRGPNNGRIMWFPPYNLKFQENVNVDWNSTTFIGRGENIYTYANTNRFGTLSFTMLIDYPSVMDNYFNDNRNKEEIEQEILRFFAGCDTPNKIIKTDSTEATNTSRTPGEEEYASTNSENSNSIRFNIYFPYKFSGIDMLQNKEWANLLIYGTNWETTISTPRGYEMLENEGITDTNKEFYRCGDLNLGYPVDNEFCILNKVNNGGGENNSCNYKKYEFNKKKDTKSFSLNSNKQKDCNTSFADIFCLMNWDKINENNTLKEHFIKCGVLSSDGEITNEVIRKIKESGSIGECKYTIKVFEQGIEKKNDVVSYEGCIGKKRGDVVKDFCEDLILKIGGNKNNDSKIENFNNVIKTQKNINSKEAKESRRVEIEILYNSPTIEGGNTENVENTTTSSDILSTNTEEVIIKEYKEYNEADYFKQLYEKDNFLKERIIEKVKYFEPAYHSISPEGFNGRLNFLHQCTRQGHTIEFGVNSSGNTGNTSTVAWNTAFGRPPVCVLRIGDFINTKMLIQSMNITYDNNGGIQWDLNPEGIGVQPMFANISLNIILIGGQSLDAPIARLNNAVSFNYYANSKIYDSRADFGVYKDNEIEYNENEGLYTPSRINTTPTSDSTNNNETQV